MRYKRLSEGASQRRPPPYRRRLSAITRTLNLMLIYVFALYGGFLVWRAAQDVPVEPGYLLAGAGFWVLRAVLQPMLSGLGNRLSVMLFACFVVAAGLHAVAAI